MDQPERILQLLGTFLPVYGIILTIIAAVLLTKGKRVVALILIPLLTLWLCSLLGSRIAYDGNLLYVSLVMLFSVALAVYYPTLLIIGIVLRIKRKSVSPNNKPKSQGPVGKRKPNR